MYLKTARIVVGVDGSASSRDAVRWAVEQVRGRDVTVDLVHAWHVPADEAVATREKLPAAVEPPAEAVAALEHAHDEELEVALEKEEAVKAAHERKAMRLLERVRDAAFREGGDRRRVRLLALEGAPGPTLVNEAADADLLIVSSHRATRIAAMVLGSVSLYCTLHATCPVVVFPTTTRRSRPAAARRQTRRPGAVDRQRARPLASTKESATARRR